VVAGSPDMGKPMTEGFQRDTGLKLVFFGGNQRDISSRVEREVRSKSLTIDIVIGGAVDQRIFLGDFVDLEVKVGNYLLRSRAHPSLRTPIGEKINVRMNPEKCLPIEDDGGLKEVA
jgi:hypothetical protein